MSKLKVLDLFSGIGGFSLGLERTEGFETVAFCEIDKKARQVLRKHWPDTPIFDDVTRLKGDQVGTIDVICGGFPCQDISYAGRGAGLAGERSGLWFEFHRLIKEIRPKWVIAENVAALRSRGLDAVLRSLAEIGYDAEWHCIPASAIGAKHKRDRIWIIAYPSEQRCDERGGDREERHVLCDQVRNATQDKPEWQRRERRISSVGETNRTELLAYPHGTGLEGCQETGNFSRCWAQINEQLARCRESNNYWSTEPNVGRVAHGVSGRVDRIKQLGNAVVPQIPQLIGSAILSCNI